jgi:hypothetical protein
MRELVLVGAATEGVIVALALLAGGGVSAGGARAAVAALAGTSVAFAAQVVAVALLRPAMRAETREFTKRWAMGMASRFGGFLAVATLILALRDVLPPAWVGGGYLGMLLVLLFTETRFLR